MRFWNGWGWDGKPETAESKRYVWRTCNSHELVVRGDVGGFGAGSQFSWNALAAYSWDFAVRNGVTYSGVLGYRALYVDYEQGSSRNKYAYDVLTHGPILGISIGF